MEVITVLTFVKYVSCFQDSVFQVPAHVGKYSTKDCLHFNYFTLLHRVSCVKKLLIWLYAAVLWFGSLMLVRWRSKHVAMFSEIL